MFDEPLSNLDARLRVEMRTEVRNVVYVTHDQIEAMTDLREPLPASATDEG